MNNLKDTILKEIKTGEVSMTPRLYFTAKWMALAATVLAVLVVTIFIFNFIFFSLRINDNNALLGFGSRGIGAFIRFFPWHLLALDIALIIFLQWLLRHFRFGYKIPVLYLIAALVFGAFTFGFVLDRATPFNDRMHDGRGKLPPPMRGFYEGAQKGHKRGSGLCRCTILAIEGNMLIVEDTRSATTTLTVLLPENDRRATTTDLKVGDIVFIAGEEKDGVITAFGVRKDGFGRNRSFKQMDATSHQF